MNYGNGVAILEVNGNERNAVFLNQDMVNAIHARSLLQREKQIQQEKEANRIAHKKFIESKKEKKIRKQVAWRTYTVKILFDIVYRVIAALLIGICYNKNLIHPYIAITIICFFLVPMFVNIGIWYGKWNHLVN